MSQKVARYAILSGLAGCYMPNSNHAQSFSTRRELADTIRNEIEWQGFPKSSFREVNIKRIWSFIQRNGSSIAHFSIQHGSYIIEFAGLTEQEFAEAEAAQDY